MSRIAIVCLLALGLFSCRAADIRPALDPAERTVTRSAAEEPTARLLDWRLTSDRERYDVSFRTVDQADAMPQDWTLRASRQDGSGKGAVKTAWKSRHAGEASIPAEARNKVAFRLSRTLKK